MRSRVALACIVAMLAGEAAAQDRLPRFADCTEPKVYKGTVKRPAITARIDSHTREKLRDTVGSDEKVNFAGHYHVAIWGCGSACVTGAIIEARSGAMIAVPFTISGWREIHDTFEGIEFRPDSRLIVFSGGRNEKGDFGWHFHVMEKGRLKFLKTDPQPDGNFLKPLE